MKAKVIEDADDVTYVVVCDPGDEAFGTLTQFARAQDLEASQITAVGAFSRATVGWFDPVTKQYRRSTVCAWRSTSCSPPRSGPWSRQTRRNAGDGRDDASNER